jgi:hypothetical protein
MDDYKLNGYAWFYNSQTGRRSLLASVKGSAEPKDIREVAAKTAKQL